MTLLCGLMQWRCGYMSAIYVDFVRMCHINTTKVSPLVGGYLIVNSRQQLECFVFIYIYILIIKCPKL